MTKPSRRTVLKALGVAGAASVVGGSNATAVAATDGQAYVRVAHASPDAPAVDVFVNDEPVLEGVEFPAVSEYLELAPGEYNVKVAPAGEGPGAAVIDTTVSVSANAFYTVAAAGALDNIQALTFRDQLTRLRAIHLAPDAPAVDIAVAGGPVLFEGVEFTQATDYVSVEPGTYDIEVRAADSDEVVKTFGDVTLEPSTTYSAFALGTPDDLLLRVADDQADQ